MNKKVISILSLLWIACFPKEMSAQQFLTAGPDKETCEGKAVQIGPPDSNPELCYKWTPETDLSCTDCPNPMASPKTTTQYTIHIVDEDFSHSIMDEMEVEIVFGDITFDKTYLKQASMETAIATLNEYDGGAVIWDFEGDDLNCQISGNGKTAVITPGSKYGTVTVTAQKSEDSECIAKAKIDVNVGVKDVEVTDVTHPGRKAKTGETLFIIGDPNVRATAIPNDGESFPAGSPDWHTPFSNSVNVPDGTVTYNHAVSTNGSAAFTAGFGAPDNKPTTQVDMIAYHEQLLPHTSLTQFFDQGLTDKVKAKGKFPKAPGPPAPQLSVELQLAGTELKTSTVENYNDPDWSHKWEFDLQASLKITGEIFHPVLTKTFALPEVWGGDTVISTKVGLAAIGTMEISGGFEKDPSKEEDDWHIKSTLTADASLALRIQASMALNLGVGWNGVAVGSASAKAGTKGTWDAGNPNVLTFTPYVNPLNAEIDIYIQRQVNPKDKRSLFPKQTWELIPKYVGEPGILSLGSLF